MYNEDAVVNSNKNQQHEQQQKQQQQRCLTNSMQCCRKNLRLTSTDVSFCAPGCVCVSAIAKHSTIAVGPSASILYFNFFKFSTGKPERSYNADIPRQLSKTFPTRAKK